MTAVNLVVGTSAAYLLSDAGAYHEDGTLQAVGSKVETCVPLRVAVSTSGLQTTDFAEGLHAWMGQQNDQAAVLAGLPELMRRDIAILAAHPDELKDCGNPSVFLQLYVATWSFRNDRPEAYVIGSPGGTFGAGYEPWTVARVAQVVQPPVDRRHYPPEGPGDDSWALPLILEQRRTPDERGIYRVGHAAELVTVNEAGIERKVIHRWARDRIGRKLRPLRLTERFRRRGSRPHQGAPAGFSDHPQ